jgi:hypothetical protein
MMPPRAPIAAASLGVARPKDRAEHRQDQRRQRDKGLEHEQQALQHGVVDDILGLRAQRRVDDRARDHVDHVQAGEQEAGDDRGGVHLDHRDAGRGRVDDEQDRGRDQDAQRAAGGDDAAGELLVVAGLEHRRQRDQPHQRDHRAHDAGGGGEKGAGDERGHRHRAGKKAQAHLQAVEQPVQDVGPLDDVAHEQEQRDRDQHIVVHHAEGVLREEVEDAVVPEVLTGGEVGVIAEADAHRHQREGDREAQEDDADEQAQHQQGNGGIAHGTSAPCCLPAPPRVLRRRPSAAASGRSSCTPGSA